METSREARGWLLWLVPAVAAVGGYLLLPADSVARSVAYDVIGLVSALMIAVAVRRRRPSQPALWWWMAAGQAVWVLGDVLYSVYDKVFHVAPFPSPADVFYLASYPLTLAGLAMVVRTRRRAFDSAGLLDAGIVVTGLGLLSWTFLIRPVLDDAATPLTTRLVAVAYPVADVLILGMLAWLLTTSAVRTASFRFLVTAVVLLLISDVAYGVATTLFTYSPSVLDAGWLLSYVLWAAAAWHPSMRRLGEPGEAPAISRGRQLALGVTMLITPGLLVAQGVTGDGQVDWLAAAIGGVILCLLSLARYTGLVRSLQRQSSRLAEMALHDDVTGLSNRRALEQRLTHLLTEPGRHPHLVVIDLDGFDQVDNRYGRAIGDALLVAVADRLGTYEPAGMLTRIGGNEFALLLDPTDQPAGRQADVETIVAPLRQLLAEPFSVAGHALLVQASIGVAGFAVAEPTAMNPVELLRRADVAVHAARQHGTGGVMAYHPQLDEKADEQARIGAALRAGLDTEQFTVFYQPIVDLADDRLVAVEALVRWQHPIWGVVGPDSFIPVAEANGLIVELGGWVLQQACAQAVRWDADLADAAPGRISVNVSARQLAEPGFAQTVAAVLTRTGLAAHRLTLEVTETAVFGGGQALGTLWAVHDLGVRVALDDFGTGHSSLGLLRDCPVDVLKIDKSFVGELTDGDRDSVIVAGLIPIIEGLGLDAVAEGVEHAAQAAQLRRYGYRLAQGYLFGRPMAADDMHRHLTHQRVARRRLDPAAA
uniref:putative bifunctional diguanylate cyclase/phosphodiesterase n=1 Tax=Paractinoplanes polyasparticus TaxID=2856853 RepID=UPI0027DECC50|nr:EAL domain-containing protein [Actinoplanes polyasparticus]